MKERCVSYCTVSQSPLAFLTFSGFRHHFQLPPRFVSFSLTTLLFIVVTTLCVVFHLPLFIFLFNHTLSLFSITLLSVLLTTFYLSCSPRFGLCCWPHFASLSQHAFISRVDHVLFLSLTPRFVSLSRPAFVCCATLCLSLSPRFVIFTDHAFGLSL